MDSIDRSIVESSGPYEVKEPENIDTIVRAFREAHKNGAHNEACDACKSLMGHAYLALRVGAGLPHLPSVIIAYSTLTRIKETPYAKDVEKASDDDLSALFPLSAVN